VINYVKHERGKTDEKGSVLLEIKEEDYNKPMKVKMPKYKATYFLKSVSVAKNSLRDGCRVNMSFNDNWLWCGTIPYGKLSKCVDLYVSSDRDVSIMVDDTTPRALEWWNSIRKCCSRETLRNFNAVKLTALFKSRDEIDAQETPEGKRMMIGMLLSLVGK
jgi:hypothetical protein